MKTKATAGALVIAALLAAAPAQAAAKSVKYVGKTSSGHKISFTVKKGKVYKAIGGLSVVCLPIQGGGSPMTGADTFDARNWWIYFNRKNMKFTEKKMQAFHYNPVTVSHTFSSKKHKGGKVTGKLRLQYSFLIPKYPIGTFAIYSCLGTATFKAKAVR
jgi:hypothetical protein